MVSIVAKKYNYVVGVDTHARRHVLCLINNLGERLGIYECRVLTKDFSQVLSLIKRKTNDARLLFAVEGTSSYGETFTGFLIRDGQAVCEVRPPKTKVRGSIGKNDAIDAELAALSVLTLPVDRLAIPRAFGERKKLRILLASRNILIKQQTMNKNALLALVRCLDTLIDAREALSMDTVAQIASCRIVGRDLKAVGMLEARRLAKEILTLAKQLKDNEKQLKDLVAAVASSLLRLHGVGAVCGAQIICSYSHKGRIRSPEAFVALAGVAPIPASSGNTNRHRLNRFGDRALNCALDIITKTRMRTDEETKRYIKKRTKEGMAMRDIRRALKRYIARSIFKHLETLNLGID